jgi:hypothetical protein
MSHLPTLKTFSCYVLYEGKVIYTASTPEEATAYADSLLNCYA